jgi:hypothetical protein
MDGGLGMVETGLYKHGDYVQARKNGVTLVGYVASLMDNGQPYRLDVPELHGDWVTVHGWDIERVSVPLPTRVGAVVRTASGRLFARTVHGVFSWADLWEGPEIEAFDDSVIGADFEVLFEGIGE